MKKYYMVHNPGNQYPTKQHVAKESAVIEANRLASTHVGKVFVVLEAIEAYQVENPAPTKLCMED
jgi:hypothetical protein